MDDLEEAIVECSSRIQVDSKKIVICNFNESNHSDLVNDDSLSPMPNVGECIVALFTDGAFPGEVTSVDGDYLEADFYVKAKVSQMRKKSLEAALDRPERESSYSQEFCATNKTCLWIKQVQHTQSGNT